MENHFHMDDGELEIEYDFYFLFQQLYSIGAALPVEKGFFIIDKKWENYPMKYIQKMEKVSNFIENF